MKIFKALLILILFAPSAIALEKFRTLADVNGVGAIINQVVGPGPELGSERLYVSYIYPNGTLDIVAIDPATGGSDVFSSPVSGQMGAWALAFGADKQLYIGTMPNAHLLRLDWKTKSLLNVGRPSRSEQYIWQLTLAADKKLYGCTFPNAKLIRFDPVTEKMEDLGRMDDKEMYARTVATDDSGFVYVGIGASRAKIVAYEIATGKYQNILPPHVIATAFTQVYRASSGAVFARINNRYFRLKGWSATEVSSSDVNQELPLTLKSGQTVHYDKEWLTVEGEIPKKINYVGKNLSLFRIASGSDGNLYGSTALPLHFFQASPKEQTWQAIGQLGKGELYSLLAFKDVVIGAAYSGDAPLMIYRPNQPYAPSTNSKGNPWLIHFSGENSGWRPLAMVRGRNNKIYIGFIPSYGLLTGGVAVLDPLTGNVELVNNIIKDQGIVSLAVLHDENIIGGTSAMGGVGSHSTQNDARIFIYDTKSNKKVFDIIAVPKQKQINALAVGTDGFIYGFAGNEFFVFDPKKQKIIKTLEHDLGSVIYNAIGVGPQGRLYGVSKKGVFTINTEFKKPLMLTKYEAGIDGGFAIDEKYIYFVSGSKIISFEL